MFGIDPESEPMEIAEKSIEMLSKFFFETLGLDDTFTKVGIKKEDFPLMAKRACGGDILVNGVKPLHQEDIEKIYEMCGEPF